jgi:hypothetical protein
MQLQEQWLEGFWAFEQWLRVSSTRHHHLAARGFTRRRENKLGNRVSVTASSPLPFLAGGGKQRHLQSQENATNNPFSFYFFLLRSGSFGSVAVCSREFIPYSRSGCWASSVQMAAGPRSKSVLPAEDELE